MGPCFNLGKGGDNETGPLNTKSYDKDGRKTKQKQKQKKTSLTSDYENSCFKS